jgi:2-polyprenyl-3-methyl-5-hydroxy-6-metoxy-1,4-benzoquinol methylase
MDRVAFSQRPPLRVVRCRGCGLVYRNPIERPAELEAVYDEDAPAPEVLQSLHDAQRRFYAARARRLTTVLGRSGTGIEVGSYVGAFLVAARDEGWRFSGVDINEATNAFARAFGFDVHTGTIESLDAERPVDVVAIWNCLDQLADPSGTIRAARARVTEGGLLVIRVPNGACYAALRPLLASPLRAAARAWLARLVERLGFRVARVVGDVLVPTADEWTRPWAALEERAMKRIGVMVARSSGRDRPLAPWFELYARAV